jgi:hypothetical protein
MNAASNDENFTRLSLSAPKDQNSVVEEACYVFATLDDQRHLNWPLLVYTLTVNWSEVVLEGPPRL